MSSEKRVDVLGVMDLLIAIMRDAPVGVRNADEARAAVAELIEASQIALNYLTENGCSRERLRTALANIGQTP